MPVGVDDLRQMFLALPEVTEGITHGTISFAVRKSFIGRLRDDDTVFALRTTFEDRDFLIGVEPDVFFTSDHYRGYPYVLIRLAPATAERLAPIFERSWRQMAPKRLVAAHDAARLTDRTTQP